MIKHFKPNALYPGQNYSVTRNITIGKKNNSQQSSVRHFITITYYYQKPIAFIYLIL